jgi:hypothetical protein
MPDAGSHTGTPPVPRILPRSQHNLSRSLIDPDAVKVMYRLVRHGYKAYLVGGSVRDLLLGRIPKDFDVATDARPAEIRRLFRNCRVIGRRFRIVHVFFRGNKIIEVSTFRRNPEDGGQQDGETEDLARKGDNAFGEPHEDAFRRDFTINGLFYDISTFSILDYVGGIDDLRIGVIRTIGDPDERFREDPVRMLRAVRHAARTGFFFGAVHLRSAPSPCSADQDGEPLPAAGRASEGSGRRSPEERLQIAQGDRSHGGVLSGACLLPRPGAETAIPFSTLLGLGSPFQARCKRRRPWAGPCSLHHVPDLSLA